MLFARDTLLVLTKRVSKFIDLSKIRWADFGRSTQLIKPLPLAWEKHHHWLNLEVSTIHWPTSVAVRDYLFLVAFISQADRGVGVRGLTIGTAGVPEPIPISSLQCRKGTRGKGSSAPHSLFTPDPPPATTRGPSRAASVAAWRRGETSSRSCTRASIIRRRPS